VCVGIRSSTLMRDVLFVSFAIVHIVNVVTYIFVNLVVRARSHTRSSEVPRGQAPRGTLPVISVETRFGLAASKDMSPVS